MICGTVASTVARAVSVPTAAAGPSRNTTTPARAMIARTTVTPDSTIILLFWGIGAPTLPVRVRRTLRLLPSAARPLGTAEPLHSTGLQRANRGGAALRTR
jgi:hypothetical protein